MGSRIYIVDSKTLFLAIITTKFLSALVNVNAFLRPLSSLTFSERRDIVKAVEEINHICISIREWFTTTEEMCKVF